MELNNKQNGVLEILYDGGYKYLTRDKTGDLKAYKMKIEKSNPYWRYSGSFLDLHIFDVFEDIVKWSDEEPFDIAKALGIVDWSTVPIDTKILVRSDDTEKWRCRYFAEYEDGKVFAFVDGRTSWTETDTRSWECAKLASDE